MERKSPLGFLIEVALPVAGAARGAVTFAVAMMLLTTVCGILALEVSRATVQVLRADVPPAEMSVVVDALSSMGVTGRRDLFLACVLLAVATPALAGLAAYLQYYVFEKVAIDVTVQVRERMFSRMLHLPHLRFQQMSAGYFIKRITEDTRELRALVMEVGLMRIADIVFIVGLIAYMVFLSPTLTFVTLLALAGYLGGAWWSAKLARGRLRLADTAFEALIQSVEQGKALFYDIRINRRTRTEQDRFHQAADHHARTMLQAVKFLLADRSITGLLGALGPVAIVAVGGAMVIDGTTGIENMLAFIAILSVLYRPVNALSAVPLILTRSGIAVENISAILDEREEGPSTATPATSRAAALIEPGSVLDIIALTFTYGEAGRRLSIDRLTIRPGERVCLVGPSGSGKTTLFRIIFGLLPSFEGMVAVNGRALSEQPLDQLRATISYMPQEARLLGASVRANVAFGLGDDGVESIEAVEQAVETVGLTREVEAMEQGLSTRIGPEGQDISGGQQRRVLLARSLISQPSLLLLDEPLNGIAAKDRQDILRTLTAGEGPRAILMTTHQEDLLRQMDRVILLGVRDDAGVLTTFLEAHGSHDWLLANVPAYRLHIGEEGPSHRG